MPRPVGPTPPGSSCARSRRCNAETALRSRAASDVRRFGGILILYAVRSIIPAMKRAFLALTAATGPRPFRPDRTACACRRDATRPRRRQGAGDTGIHPAPGRQRPVSRRSVPSRMRRVRRPVSRRSRSHRRTRIRRRCARRARTARPGIGVRARLQRRRSRRARSVLAWLRTQKYVAADRLAVVGFSMGGDAALALADTKGAAAPERFCVPPLHTIRPAMSAMVSSAFR